MEHTEPNLSSASGDVLIAEKITKRFPGTLALDQVEIMQPALGLGAEQGIEFAANPLRDACGIVHQPRNLVEESVGGLSHRWPPGLAKSALRRHGRA